VGQELKGVEVEPHLVEVPMPLMLRILEMPLTQPYVKQGLGLHLEVDQVDQVDQKDQEDLEEALLHQSQLHTWFQS